MASTTTGRSSTKAVSTPYADRIKRLRATVKKNGAEHFLVTNPLDVAYLTGFRGGDSYLIISPKGCTVISDFRYQEELESVRALAKIVIRKGAMSRAVADVFSEAGIGDCLIQAETMTIAERDALGAVLGGRGAKRLVPCTGLVGRMRRIKDDSEVALIRAAAKIQEQALLAVLPTLKPGQTELEVAAALEAEMKRRGSSAPGFETIVAADPNGSLPHYRPGRTKLRQNRALLIDWGAIYQGYHSDMTRVFAFGKWPAKIAEIYQITLDAQEMAAAALKPGVSTQDIDAIARGHITKHGYGDCFGHGLGHGLGFNGHEDPRLSHMVSGTVLEPGDVVTVEPGIYLPGIGGVRIEDDYVITQKGAKCLCTLPKDLDWATLG